MDRFDCLNDSSTGGKSAYDRTNANDKCAVLPDVSGHRSENLGFFPLTRFVDSIESNSKCPALDVNNSNAGQPKFWGGEGPYFGMAVQAEGLRTEVQRNVHFVPLESSSSYNAEDSSLPETRLNLHEESQLKRDIPASIISPKVIDSLIKSINLALQRSDCRDNFEFIKSTTGTLYNISCDDRTLDFILKFHGIPVLISLLRSDAAIILINAASVLQKLLLNRQETAEIVELSDGTRKLIALLNRGEQKLLAVVIDCLSILAIKSDEAKFIILHCKAHKAVVDILKVAKNEILMLTASRLLRVLSSNSRSKVAVVSAGGVDVLTERLCSTRVKYIKFNCLSALKNLSDIMGTFDLLGKLIGFCVSALHSSNLNIVSFSVGILANVTCQISRNKNLALRSGCVDVLVRRARDPSSTDNIIEGAVFILKNLASKHRSCVTVRKELKENGACDMIDELLKPPYRWPIVKVVVDLLRIMTSCRKVGKFFGCYVTLHNLLSLMNVAWRSIHECSGGVPRMRYSSEYVISVLTEDCIEGILLALHNFAARSKENREAMIKQNVVNISIDLLAHSMPILQDAAVVLLLQLLRGPTGFKILKQPDTWCTLVRVFNSSPSAANRAKLFIEKVAPCMSFELIEAINEPMPSNNVGLTGAAVKKVEVATETTFTPQEASDSFLSVGGVTDSCQWGDNSNSEADMALWKALIGITTSDVRENSFDFRVSEKE